LFNEAVLNFRTAFLLYGEENPYIIEEAKEHTMTQNNCQKCGTALSDHVKFCPSCGTKALRELSPTAAQAVKHPMGKRAKILYSSLAILLFGLFLFIFTKHLPGGAHPIIEKQPEIAMATMYMGQTLEAQPIAVDIEGGAITFPLSLLLEKKFVSFEYKAPTGPLPLLAYISAEGKLVTAVGICEPCNSHTFRIEGMELACGNCETRWKLNNLEGLQGSCQKYPPDPIPSTIENNLVRIDENSVKKWKFRI
jgi:hypothetical protein